MVCKNGGNDPAPTATQNGVQLSVFVKIQGSSDRCAWYYAYLANPQSGLFQLNFASPSAGDYMLLTLQGTEQVVPDDISAVANGITTAVTTAITTSASNDLLLSMGARVTSAFSVYGTGQSEIANQNDPIGYVAATWKAAATRPGSETTSGSSTNSVHTDWATVGFKPAAAASTTGSYRAKVDDGSYNWYNFANNTWTVYDRKGTRYLFGSDDSGRIYDTSSGTSTKTYKWMLQEVRDTNNNYIKYTYLRDGNQLYPYHITYTGYGSTDGPFTIAFATSTRTDVKVDYSPGFTATTSSRISQITAAVNGTNARQYNLSYTTGNNGYRSLLSGLGEIGWDDNGVLATTPTTTFNYEWRTQPTL
jgi:Salmonella virulence plasmid 65kDa B protein